MDKQSETREYYFGIGVALGSKLGMVIGVGLGSAFGNLLWDIGSVLFIHTGVGIARGAARGNKHANGEAAP